MHSTTATTAKVRVAAKGGHTSSGLYGTMTEAAVSLGQRSQPPRLPQLTKRHLRQHKAQAKGARHQPNRCQGLHGKLLSPSNHGFRYHIL